MNRRDYQRAWKAFQRLYCTLRQRCFVLEAEETMSEYYYQEFPSEDFDRWKTTDPRDYADDPNMRDDDDEYARWVDEQLMDDEDAGDQADWPAENEVG